MSTHPAGFYRTIIGSEPRSGITIVFLHGFLQQHSCWRDTAQALSDIHGHDALLLDFYYHGASGPAPGSTLGPQDLVRQLRAALEELGWQHRRLVLAGLSLGGAVALHYWLAYPETVSRLVLVGSGGLSERRECSLSPHLSWLTRLGLQYLKALPRAEWMSHPLRDSLHEVRCRATLAAAAPEYGVPQDIPEWLREANVPLSLVVGGLDVMHTPQLKRWAAGRTIQFLPSNADRPLRTASTAPLSVQDSLTYFYAKREGERFKQSSNAALEQLHQQESNVLRVIYTPYMDHVLLCHSIASLKLWKIPHLWTSRELDSRL